MSSSTPTNDFAMSISVASAVVGVLSRFLEVLFSTIYFSASKLLKRVPFSRSVSTCWLNLCSGEDARKCSALHAVAWSVSSRLHCCSEVLSYLVIHIVESPKLRRSTPLCATVRWLSKPFFKAKICASHHVALAHHYTKSCWALTILQ